LKRSKNTVDRNSIFTEHGGMLTHHLASLIEAYLHRTGDKATALSSRVFDDSRVIPRFLNHESSVTLRRAEMLIAYLSHHWPSDLDWPDAITRPVMSLHGDMTPSSPNHPAD
jgi:hypothetical protein